MRQKAARGVDNGSAGRAGIRNRVDDEILHSDVEQRGRADGHEERERNVFARVAGFTGSDERRFKSAVGVNHQKQSFEPIGGSGERRCRIRAQVRMKRERGETGDDEESE